MDEVEPAFGGVSMKSDVISETTPVYHRIFMALLLVLALGGSMFPLEYACSPHEKSRHYLALIVAIAIPMPWVVIVRMNWKIKKIHNLIGQSSDEMQEVLRISSETSLSILFAVYLIIIVLSSNLFSSWK